MTTCTSCGAPIFWVETVNGSRMPVDVNPKPDGNVLLGDRAVVLAHDAARPNDKLLYTSHFATCPHAGKHRKRRAK